MAYKNTEKPNKSKYLRDPSEKKTSKYVRDKNDAKPRSKYARNPYEERERHYNLTRNIREEEEIAEEILSDEIENEEVSEIVSEAGQNDEVIAENPVENIEETENSPEFDETSVDENADTDDELMSLEEFEVESDSSERERSKGNASSLFAHSGLSRETTVAQVEDEEEQRRKLVIMTIIVIIVLTVSSVLLQFGAIGIKTYTPSMLNYEISLLPEFIASLAYGPLFALIIIVLKTVVYLLTASTVTYASAISTFVLDTVFCFVGGLFYSTRMMSFNPKRSSKLKNKDMRRKRVFLGGLLATAVTTTISYFLTTYVSYPLIIRQYAERGMNEYMIIENYQAALNNLNSALPETISGAVTQFSSLSEAILFYNVPLTIIKLLFVTVIATIIYPVISPYIHFRRK